MSISDNTQVPLSPKLPPPPPPLQRAEGGPITVIITQGPPKALPPPPVPNAQRSRPLPEPPMAQKLGYQLKQIDISAPDFKQKCTAFLDALSLAAKQGKIKVDDCKQLTEAVGQKVEENKAYFKDMGPTDEAQFGDMSVEATQPQAVEPTNDELFNIQLGPKTEVVSPPKTGIEQAKADENFAKSLKNFTDRLENLKENFSAKGLSALQADIAKANTPDLRSAQAGKLDVLMLKTQQLHSQNFAKIMEDEDRADLALRGITIEARKPEVMESSRKRSEALSEKDLADIQTRAKKASISSKELEKLRNKGLTGDSSKQRSASAPSRILKEGQAVLQEIGNTKPRSSSQAGKFFKAIRNVFRHEHKATSATANVAEKTDKSPKNQKEIS